MQEKLDLELDLFRKVRKKLEDEFCGSKRGTHEVKKYEDRWEFYREVFRDGIDRINKPEFTATEVRDESRGIEYRVVVFSGLIFKRT
jgi:hypothetical protein